MKFLVDCHCFDFPIPQGINTYLCGLYSALIPMAQDIEFVLAANNTDRLKAIFGEADNIFYVQIPHEGSLKRLVSVFPALIKKHGIDIAHFQYVAPFIKKCKTVVTLHDILFMDFPDYFPFTYKLTKGLMFRYAATHADMLLTVSDYSRKRIAAHYHIPEDTIMVTPNAVTDRFSSVSRVNAQNYVKEQYGIDNYIFYVSRLEPRKDQYGLIKAYAESQLAKQGFYLVIAGEESIKDVRIGTLMAQIPSDVKSMIRFLHGIDDTSLIYLFKGASLFVYPSKAEGFGIPPLEAAVAEIATICNNATAMSSFDFFGHRLIDTSHTECLSQAMVDTLKNPPSEQELKQIHSDVMNRYNWETIAKSFHAELLSRFNLGRKG